MCTYTYMKIQLSYIRIDVPRTCLTSTFEGKYHISSKIGVKKVPSLDALPAMFGTLLCLASRSWGPFVPQARS